MLNLVRLFSVLFRLNPEHKSCFKWVLCFNLRSFSEYFHVHESVVCPITLINKDNFNQFWVHFFMSPIPCDVNSQDTKFGSKIFHSLAVIEINVFQNQYRSWSKRVLNKTDVQDLPVYVLYMLFLLLEPCMWHVRTVKIFSKLN